MKNFEIRIKFKYDEFHKPTSQDYGIIDHLIDLFIRQYERIFSLMGLKLSCHCLYELDYENPYVFTTSYEDYKEGDEIL